MEPFSPAVEKFIAQHVQSLAQLESLLMIRQERDRIWTREDLTKRLYLGAEDCAAILADLESRGFVRRVEADNSQFQYYSRDPAIDALVDQLAATYQERRVAVITQIYSKPINKVQTFADAFRFRHKEP